MERAVLRFSRTDGKVAPTPAIRGTETERQGSIPKQSLVLLNGFERWLESLARIAAEHGFSSPTRFAQVFRRKYGVYPSEMLRDRYDTLVE